MGLMVVPAVALRVLFLSLLGLRFCCRLLVVVCLCLSGGFLVDWLIVLVRLFFCVVLVFSCILIWGRFGCLCFGLLMVWIWGCCLLSALCFCCFGFGVLFWFWVGYYGCLWFVICFM